MYLFAQTSVPVLIVHLSSNFTVRVYALSQPFHAGLPGYLSDQIERIQKRALRIVYPELPYSEGLADANLMSRCERREHLCITESDGQHKLARLLPRATAHDTVQGISECSLYVILRPKDFKILL